MLKRTFWFTTGATAGFGGAMWVRRQVLRTVRRYTPEQVQADVTTSVRRFGTDLREAVTTGRAAMVDREAELRTELRPGAGPALVPVARAGERCSRAGVGIRHRPRRRAVAADGPQANTPLTVRLNSSYGTANRLRVASRLDRVLRGQAAHDRAVGQPHPDASQRAHVHQLGDDAVRPLLPGRGGGAVQPPPGGVGAALRAGRWQAQRPRRHRSVAAAPQLLRDDGQLQLRRLLQARGDRLGVGVRDRGARARRRPPVGHRPRERRRGRGPVGRRGRLPPPAHPAPRQGQLLGDGGDRPVRPVVRDLLGLRARRRARGRPGQPRGRGPLRRDLEPGVPAVPAGGRRPAQRPAQQEHRHRRRARAHPRGARRAAPASTRPTPCRRSSTRRSRSRVTASASPISATSPCG